MNPELRQLATVIEYDCDPLMEPLNVCTCRTNTI